MARPLAALLTLLLVLNTTPAAPALKPKGPGVYHPTKAGARWVYQDGAAEHTFVVTRAEARDGGTVADIAVVKEGREVHCQQMLVSDEGVFRLSVGGTSYSTPECLLKLPHRDGQTWEFDLGPDGGGASRLTAIGRERVEVPAGVFDAIRVEREGGSPATYWFAEGVGLIKSVSGPRYERVLKSFTPAPKD